MEKLDNKEFMNEGIDLKRLFLCFKQKLLLIIAITLIGALLGGGTYLLVRLISMPVLYQSQSKFYLQYIYDPSGAVEQYYNAFTWNDLLHADPILDEVIAALKTLPDGKLVLNGAPESDEKYKERLRDNMLRAVLLSDRRLLTIFFTTTDPHMTSVVQKAVEIGLINYAAGSHEIISMEIIRSTEPQLFIWDDHTLRAAIGGAVLFLILALFGWWFYFILDDSLFTVKDAENRYPFPAAGILLVGESYETESLYFTETKENLAYILNDKQNPRYLSVEELPYPSGAALRETDGIILEVPFGGRNGKLIDRCVSYLKSQDVPILGLLITDADKKFLSFYYKGKV